LPQFMQHLERGWCYEEENVLERLEELTGGRGPDACIDAVGMEAHGHAATKPSDRAKPALVLETDQPIALREAIEACRNGGIVSVTGRYGGFIDRFPMPRAALHAAPARAHPARRDRSELRDHPPPAAGARARRLST
jgi:threonine dehydrogenase-like Zn-dependent dehydrogenase